MQRGDAWQARLVAVGDVMPGDSAVTTGYGFASRYDSGGGTHVISRLRHLFSGADIVLGNLEGTLSDVGHLPHRWSSTQYRGHPAFAGVLRDAGFRIMSVANNHAAQHGVEAFTDTVRILREAGIECCGISGSRGWCAEPTVVSVNGLQLGFLAYCRRPRQYSRRTPPYAEGTVNELCDDIDRLRRDVDHVVTSLHWGEEFVTMPSVSEVGLAHRLAEAGSSVIVGHHPHVGRPVERANGGVIAYSLGNFISDMIWYSRLRSGVMLTVALAEDSAEANATSVWVDDTYLPIETGPQRLEAHRLVNGLDEEQYKRQAARTVRENRLASYAHALKNAGKFRSHTFRQLISTTLRRKMAAPRPLGRP